MIKLSLKAFLKFIPFTEENYDHLYNFIVMISMQEAHMITKKSKSERLPTTFDDIRHSIISSILHGGSPSKNKDVVEKKGSMYPSK